MPRNSNRSTCIQLRTVKVEATFLLLASLCASHTLAQTLETFDPVSGRGVLVWPDGSRYEGEIVNNMMHGKGVLNLPYGRKITGDFWRGHVHGQAVEIGQFGNRYEGDFVQGKRFGRGKFLKFDGQTYDGDFIAGEFSGKGAFTDPQRGSYVGLVTEGHFLSWQLNGQGKITYNRSQAAVAEGGFINGVQNGPGKKRVNGDPDARYWSADFVNGRMDGPAYFVNGTKRTEGYAKNGNYDNLRKGQERVERSAQNIELEKEVERLTALAEKHHAIATSIHLATSPEERLSLARAVEGASPSAGQVANSSTSPNSAVVARSGSASASPNTPLTAQAKPKPAERPFETILINENGVDVPKKVTTQLQSGEGGTVSICGRRFLYAGVAEDGVRSFTCGGSGLVGGGTYIDGSRTGELQWGYAIDTDGVSLKTKTYQAWGESRFPEAGESATLIYYRFTSGPLAGRSFGTVVGKAPGSNALYLSSNYYAR